MKRVSSAAQVHVKLDVDFRRFLRSHVMFFSGIRLLANYCHHHGTHSRAKSSRDWLQRVIGHWPDVCASPATSFPSEIADLHDAFSRMQPRLINKDCPARTTVLQPTPLLLDCILLMDCSSSFGAAPTTPGLGTDEMPF